MHLISRPQSVIYDFKLRGNVTALLIAYDVLFSIQGGTRSGGSAADDVCAAGISVFQWMWALFENTHEVIKSSGAEVVNQGGGGYYGIVVNKYACEVSGWPTRQHGSGRG